MIYVAPGQEDQREILRNSTGSGLYSEFLKGLGWFVSETFVRKTKEF